MERKRTSPIAAATSALLVAVAGFAGETTDEELSLIARSVAEAVRGEGESQVAIGQFTSPPQLQANAGPGLSKRLGDALERQGVSVNNRARLWVEGKYRQSQDNTSGRVNAKLTTDLMTRDGQAVKSFDRAIGGSGQVAALLGVTVALPPEQSEKDRNKELAKRLTEPAVAIAGTQVAAAPKSPYRIEILVKRGDDYKPLPLEVREGMAFAPLRRDDQYAVRLVNDADLEAAVKLSIDGLSVFAFSENKSLEHFIVPAHGGGLVKGWVISPERSDALTVTSYSASAAAKELKSGAAVGVITAEFAAAWPKSNPIPGDELAAQLASRGGEDLATGRGPAIATASKVVERNIGALRAVVSVRYSRRD